VPIALAYSVAHHFSYFVLEGQAIVALLSDPIGFGWDLFGTAGRAIDYGVLSSTAVAFVSAMAIVAGHVAGVFVAHDRALALFPAREATRSQYPLIAAMVLFTSVACSCWSADDRPAGPRRGGWRRGRGPRAGRAPGGLQAPRPSRPPAS